MRKVLFISLGCDKNLADSEEMLGLLVGNGYEITNDESEAEAIVINTCAFIHDAKQESVNSILEMARYKETGQLKALLVTGCLAQRYQKEIIEEIPEVDAVLGTGSWDELIQALDKVFEGEKYLDFQSIDSLLHVQGVFSEQSDVRAGYEDIGVVVHKYLLTVVETVAYAEYPVLKVKSGKVRQALSVDKAVDAGAGIAGFFKQIFLSVDEDAVLSAPEPDPRHLPRRSGSGGECADDVTAILYVILSCPPLRQVLRQGRRMQSRRGGRRGRPVPRCRLLHGCSGR